MKQQPLLDLLTDAALALRLPGVTRETIARPNELPETSDSEFRFEVYVEDFNAVPDSELSSASVGCGVIVASAPLGSGSDRLDAVANALVDIVRLWRVQPFRNMVVTESLFREKKVKRESRVYVAGVDRSNGLVVDGRYKVNIVVQFEIYEEDYYERN